MAAKMKYTTKFEEPNWGERTAYTIGYNNAIDDLINFLVDKMEDLI